MASKRKRSSLANFGFLKSKKLALEEVDSVAALDPLAPRAEDCEVVAECSYDTAGTHPLAVAAASTRDLPVGWTAHVCCGWMVK